MPERLNGAVSKTVDLRTPGVRGFESHPLRQVIEDMEKVLKARENLRNYLAKNGVEIEYTGIGVDNFTKKDTIRVGVINKTLVDKVPKFFEGYDVIVEVTSGMKALDR